MLRDVIANWSYIGISAITAFVLYPFFVDVLGEGQYGVWLLISSITGYFSLLQFGLPLANVRFLSFYWAKESFEDVNTVLRSNLMFLLGIDVIVLLAGGLLAALLESAFGVPPAFAAASRIALAVASVEVAFRFLGTLFEGVFHAQKRFVALNVIFNVAVAGRLAASLLLVTADEGLLIVALIQLGATLFQLVSFCAYIRREFPMIVIGSGRFDRDMLKEVFGYSAYALLLDVAARLSFNTDPMVIGSVLSVEDIVPFGVANSILTYFMMFTIGFSAALMPRVTEAAAKGETKGLAETYVRYSRIVAFAVIPICMSFWRFGDDFIALWMGERFRVSAGAPLTILALGYAFFLVQRGVAFPILMGLSKMAFATKLMFAGAVVNVLLSVWLAPHLGLSGVALGTTGPLLGITFALAVHVCRVLGTSPSSYLLRAVVLPALSALPFWAAAVSVESAFSAASPAGFVGSTAICVGSYATVTYLLFLDHSERRLLAGAVGSRFCRR